MDNVESMVVRQVIEQLKSWDDPEPRTHYADCWKNHLPCLMQLAAAWLEELCEPEQAMPTEASSSECEHIGSTGYCWCETGMLRCPECQEWLGLGHARKAILHTPECDVHEAFADALAKNHFALNYCPKCGEKL